MSNKKDNVDLICNVAELAGMFEKTSSLSTFLDSTVSMVAWHMKAAVCSIYLLKDGSDELVLRATQGLNPEAVGKVKLRVGEGITGRSIKELRTIRVGHASSHKHYKYFPGIEEERFEAFLAVPIVRGLIRIGVLVVQDPASDYFTVNDEKALKAIAGQLATTLENARLLMNLGIEEKVDSEQEKGALPEFIVGKSASKGVAIGTATVTTHKSMDLPEIAESLPKNISLDQFKHALKATEEELEGLQVVLGTEHEDIAGLIFNAHLLMLKDESFSGQMISSISEGSPVAEAVLQTVNSYVDLFSKSPNPRLKEKVQDVLDLGHRLLLNLQGEEKKDHDYKNQIIVAADLMPSDVVRFAVQRAEGIVLMRRGITAHISILARSMQIPMIQVDTKHLVSLRDNTPLIMDASQGTLFIYPGEDVRSRYQVLQETKENLSDLADQMEEVTRTRDGTGVALLANVNLLSDLDIAQKLKANGVGLYRSEFPFLIRDSFPTEEEQYKIYSRVLEKFPTQEVVFRTLDIGGDKLATYADAVEEENPFLGLRAIRFSFKHPEIFRQQLRAMLRAGFKHELKIMFPLVSSTDEFLQAREFVFECIRELRQGDEPFNSEPKLGIMIELPSAVELVDELAEMADFLSIGSNDLTQYLLAVDRTNNQVSHMYLEYHPAVLRALNRIAEAGHKWKKSVSICGEMAANEKMLPFLLGIGLRRISVDPRSIPEVQAKIQKGKISDFKKQAKAMLALGSVREVEAFLESKDQGISLCAEPAHSID